MKFKDLSEKAKNRVRERQPVYDDWWDGVYEFARDEGRERGFEIADIQFSGLGSQGVRAAWQGEVLVAPFIDYHIKPDTHPEDYDEHGNVLENDRVEP